MVKKRFTRRKLHRKNTRSRRKKVKRTRRLHGKGNGKEEQKKERMCKNIINDYLKCKNEKGVSNEDCLAMFKQLKQCMNK